MASLLDAPLEKASVAKSRKLNNPMEKRSHSRSSRKTRRDSTQDSSSIAKMSLRRHLSLTILTLSSTSLSKKMRSTLTRRENRRKLLTSPKSWFLEANFLTSLLHLVPSVTKSADITLNNFWWHSTTYIPMASAIVTWSSKISCLTMRIIAKSLTSDSQLNYKEEMARGSTSLDVAQYLTSRQNS